MRRTALLALVTAFMPLIATAQLVRHNSIPEVYWGTGRQLRQHARTG